MSDNIYSIAIDGPAGAGKSTIAKEIANYFNIEYIDTGAMYRALTLKVLNNNIDPKDTKRIIELLGETEIDFKDNHIYLDGVNVDNLIRHNNINRNVSHVSKIKEVRDQMLHIQQKMALKKSVVMDGRDIGSIVLPNSDFKIFITASVEERSKRRYKEHLEKGDDKVTYEQVLTDINKRDEIDINRKVAPLVKADDAILIDTSDKSIEEVLDIIIAIIERGI